MEDVRYADPADMKAVDPEDGAEPGRLKRKV